MHVGVLVVLILLFLIALFLTDNVIFIWCIFGISVLFLMTTRGTKR